MNYTTGYRWAVLVAVLITTAVCPVRAQSSYVAASSVALPEASASIGSDSTDSILTIKKRVDEVNVLFIATDHHGKFVRNLNQGDFTILDDHKPPQSIVNFRRETDLPLEWDYWWIPADRCTAVSISNRRLPSVFCSIRCGPNFDKAFVMGFSTHSQVTQEFTDNVRLARNRRAKSAQRRRHGDV